VTSGPRPATYRRAWRRLGIALTVATCIALVGDPAALVAITLARAWACKQVQLPHVDLEPPSGYLRQLRAQCDPNYQPPWRKPTPEPISPRTAAPVGRSKPYTVETPHGDAVLGPPVG
jgi:hypothetical protein